VVFETSSQLYRKSFR